MIRHNLVVGKFLPPHVGHHQLIDQALDVGDTTIVVCDNPHNTPSALVRAEWMQTIHPHANVMIAADLCGAHGGGTCPPECSPAWARHLYQLGLPPVTDLWVNEPYGTLFAKALGATLHQPDPTRQIASISATQIRQDTTGNWKWLHPVVRAGLTRRIAIIGAESTGTTTLARALAIALGGTALTSETGRSVSWALTSQHGNIDNVTWTPEHFRHILLAQRQAETQATLLQAVGGQVGPAGPWLVCDTDALATVAWWERYVGEGSAWAAEYAATNPADLYIVTSPDGIEFHQDGIRDGQHLRDSMHQRFCELAAASGSPWIIAGGTRQQRLAAAVELVENHNTAHPLCEL